MKDEHDEARDMTLARHVMKVIYKLTHYFKAKSSILTYWVLVQVHMNAAADNAVEGELSLAFLKKYIGYCRSLIGL